MVTFTRKHRVRSLAVAAALVSAAGAGVVVSNTIRASSSNAQSAVVTVDPGRPLDTRFDIGLASVTSLTNIKLDLTGTIPVSVQDSPVDRLVIPDGATGALLNVTAVGPQAGGFVSIRPGTASGVPSTSSLNVLPGQTVPNSVQVALPTSGPNAGQIDIWYGTETPGQTTDLVIDIVGYTTEIVGGTGPVGPPGPAGADGDELYDRVLVVSGDGTPTENGTALADAFTEAEGLSPTAAKPVMIFLEPGVFERGSWGKVPGNVAIVGSGIGVTTLRATSPADTFANDGGDLTFRDLSITRTVNGTIIDFSDDVLMIDRVALRSEFENRGVAAIDVSGSAIARVNDSSYHTAGNGWFFLTGDSELFMDSATLTSTVPAGVSPAAPVILQDSRAVIAGSDLTALRVTDSAVVSPGGELTVTNSTLAGIFVAELRSSDDIVVAVSYTQMGDFGWSPTSSYTGDIRLDLDHVSLASAATDEISVNPTLATYSYVDIQGGSFKGATKLCVFSVVGTAPVNSSCN